MQLKLTVPLLAAIAPLVVSADGVTAVSAPLTVDLRSENELLCVVGTTDIGYSAKWISDAAAAETRCVVTATVRAGTEKHVDTTLADTTAEGAVTLAPSSDERVYRVTMTALNGSTELGSVTREISFGILSSAEQEVRGDTTDAKLQNAVDAGMMSFDLVCDTSWTPDAASAVITQKKSLWTSKRDRAPAETTTVLAETAPYDGACAHVIPPNQGQDCEFTLVFRDADGNPIGEPLVACYSKSCKFGCSLFVR